MKGKQTKELRQWKQEFAEHFYESYELEMADSIQAQVAVIGKLVWNSPQDSPILPTKSKAHLEAGLAYLRKAQSHFQKAVNEMRRKENYANTQ